MAPRARAYFFRRFRIVFVFMQVGIRIVLAFVILQFGKLLPHAVAVFSFAEVLKLVLI